MQPQLFNFNGKNIRTLTINHQPYFIGNDAAIILGYSDYRHAVVNHVNDEDKLRVRIDHAGQNREMTAINESGLYDLIFDASRQSKNPEVRENARKFRHWVTNEVLPSIRKTGSYSIQRKPDSYMIDDPVKRAERWIEERKAYEALVPKGQYFDSQMRNPGTMTVTEIAKDYGMSAREFNQLLHKYGIQFKQGKHWVLYHKYDGKGYTQYEPFAYNDNKGVHNNLKWTQRGRKFIYDTLKEHGILPVLEQPELLPEVNAVD